MKEDDLDWVKLKEMHAWQRYNRFCHRVRVRRAHCLKVGAYGILTALCIYTFYIIYQMYIVHTYEFLLVWYINPENRSHNHFKIELMLSTSRYLLASLNRIIFFRVTYIWVSFYFSSPSSNYSQRSSDSLLGIYCKCQHSSFQYM